MSPGGRGCLLLAGGIFLVALAVQLPCVAPTIALMDGAEFTLAARTLGIAHPSGYPVASLLGRLLDLLPWGCAGYRVNLASSLSAALAAGIAALWLARRAGYAAGLAGGILVLGMPSLREAAATGEVYPLLVAIALGLLALATGLRGDPRSLVGASLLWGLGTAHHQLALLLLPSLALALWQRRRSLRPALLGMVLLAALLGLSAYLYLPLRSAASPPMDRGSPKTAAAFLEVVAKRGETSLGDLRQDPWSNARIHLGVLKREIPAHLGLGGGILALVGSVYLALRRRCWLAVLAAWGGVPACVVTLAFFTRHPGIAYMVEPFFLPLYVALALTAGLGTGLIVHRIRGPLWKVAAGTVMVTLCLLPLHAGWARGDHQEDTLAYDWARNALLSLPPEALGIVAVDEYFPLLYCQLVEGLREDLRIAHVRELSEEPGGWWDRILTPHPRVVYRIGGSAPRSEDRSEERAREALEDYLERSPRRDVVLVHYVQGLLPQGWRVAVRGIVYPVVPRHPFDPAGELSLTRALWSRYRLRALQDGLGSLPGPHLDFVHQYAAGLNNLGAYATRLGHQEVAEGAWKTALRLEPGNPVSRRLLRDEAP